MSFFTCQKNNRIHYELSGSGEPLVLISGFTADKGVWALVKPDLEKNFEVLSFDNRGVGESDVPISPYSIEEMAQDVWELVEHHFRAKKVHLVGHSMGGAIVQTMVKINPAKIASCIIANSFASLPAPFRYVCEYKLSLYEAKSDRFFIERCAIPWAFGQKFLEDPVAMEAVDKNIRNHPHPQTYLGYKNQWHALKNFSSALDPIPSYIPTLILTGSDDLIAPLKCSEDLKKLIPHAKHVIFDQIGHVPQVENPREFSETVIRFLPTA